MALVSGMMDLLQEVVIVKANGSNRENPIDVDAWQVLFKALPSLLFSMAFVFSQTIVSPFFPGEHRLAQGKAHRGTMHPLIDAQSCSWRRSVP